MSIKVIIVEDRPIINISVDEFASQRAVEAAKKAKESEEQTALDRIATGEDRVATGLDRVATGLDRVQTGLDRIATGADAIATAADRVQTGLDRIATESDRVQTGLDRIATGSDAGQTELDRIATGEDRIQTGLDRVATGEDRVQTGLDRVATGEDRIATAADSFQTGLDAIATAADRVQTGLDRIATGEDRVQTGLDRVATGNDRIATGADVVQTGLDRIATGEDRVQTGLDRVQTGLDRIAAADSAASAAQVGTSTPLTGFTVGGNTAIAGTDTILQGFGNTQGQINERIGGTVGLGQVAFGTGTKVLGGDSGLVWDNTNKQLGVGTSSPITILHTKGNIIIDGLASATFFEGDRARFMYGATPTAASKVAFGSSWATINDFAVLTKTSGDFTESSIKFLVKMNGNVLIGTTTDAGFKLDVNGTARVQGELTVNGVSVGLGGGSVSLNTRVGFQALQNNTTGSNNTANGYAALFFNTTGSSNTANGLNALLNNTTGSSNTANGLNAGRFLADGSTALTIANNSVFLGVDTRANADNETNQIVIGHTAIGAGSNTATLGNTSIVDTVLRGRINIQQYATGSRPTYVKGALIYDSTLSKLVVGGALDWEVITSV
jgi:uncharacterized phage infection (PIP) family protein YhgE